MIACLLLNLHQGLLVRTCTNLVLWIDLRWTVSFTLSWRRRHLILLSLGEQVTCLHPTDSGTQSASSILLNRQLLACLASNLAIFQLLYFCRMSFCLCLTFEKEHLFLIQYELLILVCFGNHLLHWRSSCLNFQLRGSSLTMDWARSLQNRDALLLEMVLFSFEDRMSSSSSWDLLLVLRRLG